MAITIAIYSQIIIHDEWFTMINVDHTSHAGWFIPQKQFIIHDGGSMIIWLRGELGLLFLARPAGQSVLIPAGRPARRVYELRPAGRLNSV